uniref:Uncharacterized protein n=1 Tax=Romanomermis culicivorax TaxID=13658 RepID=A0A915HUT3_ROMCU
MESESEFETSSVACTVRVYCKNLNLESESKSQLIESVESDSEFETKKKLPRSKNKSGIQLHVVFSDNLFQILKNLLNQNKTQWYLATGKFDYTSVKLAEQNSRQPSGIFFSKQH